MTSTTPNAPSMRTPPTVAASEEFRTSGDPRADLLEQGYHVARGLLDPDEVRALRADLLHEADRAGWLAPGSDPADALPGEARAHDESDPDDYVPVYRRVQGNEAFHALGRSPRIQALVSQALGEEAFSLPAKIARFNFPDVTPTAPHQDYYYVQGSTDTITSWIPLGPCRAGGGRLIVLAGSQLLGPLPPLPNPAMGGFWIDTADLGCTWHGGDFEAGDVLLFHSLTVHAAEPNTSGRVRTSIDGRWQPVADPIAEKSLQPHYLEDVTWEELYEGWDGDEHRWYWDDLPLELLPRATDVGQMTDRARASSRFLGERWGQPGTGA